ncbi:hypothetical protein [Mesorhizobium sp.]|uniref:hypothetical protein n=1 Tax=Mesorhizobium sp. TaxID=1871066 RepID=UPI0025FB5528|nr:hypothetical protein [Mesorhizobium sp.]
MNVDLHRGKLHVGGLYERPGVSSDEYARAGSSSDGRSFATARKHVVSIWITADGALTPRVNSWPYSLAFSPDGSRMLAGALGLALQALAFCLFGGLDQRQRCVPVLLLFLPMRRQGRLDVLKNVIVDLLPSRQQQFFALRETFAGWEENLSIPPSQVPSGGRRP